MIGLLINLLILALIFGVVWWIINQISLPPPFGMIVRVVFALIVLIICIDMLVGVSGVGWHPIWRGGYY